MKYLLVTKTLLLAGLVQLTLAGVLMAWADEEGVQQPERALVDYQKLLLDAMLEQVEEEEIRHLDLDEERSFLLLHLEALAAQPKGHLLLLHGEGQHPNWPVGIAPLRQQLAAHGWSTWSLSLPQYRPSGPPARTLAVEPLLSRLGPESDPEAVDPGDDGGNEPPPAPAESSDPAERLAEQQGGVEERLVAALAQLEGGERHLLVLQDEAVFWLLPWLQAGNWPDDFPILLLNARVPEGASGSDLARLLRGLGSQPILDIYDPASGDLRRLAEQREAAYLRAGNDRAVQLQLEPAHGKRQGSQSRWLVQRVEGWLRSL